jgi:hypothetical protein
MTLSQSDNDVPSPWERQRASIQRSLTRITSQMEIEANRTYLVDISAYLGLPNEWAEVSQTWHDFTAQIANGDELWEFNTVTQLGAHWSGEEGFALVRKKKVVAWYITAVSG